MAFLEELGRSNALSSVNSLMGKAIEMRQGEDRSAERAYTMGLQAEELGIHKAAAERETTKFGWQAEEHAKKQKFLKSVVPVDTILQNARPGSRESLLKLGKGNGWIQDVGGTLVISNENIANAKQYLHTNLEFTGQLALTDIADINKEMIPLKQRVAELKATKPDDKTIPILEKQISDLDQQKTEHLNSVLEIDKAFQEKKALKGMESKTWDWQTIKDENSVTGWSKINSRTGDIVDGVAPPASAVAETRAGTAEKRLTETGRHNKEMEAIATRKAAGGGVGGKKTALIQNTEFLATLGWAKEDAAKLLSGSKPMSRESYIGTTTSKIMVNEMIPEDEKANRVREAISVYDTFMTKPGASPTSIGAIPPGYKDTGKTHNGKKLYKNDKAPKGKEYWTP